MILKRVVTGVQVLTIVVVVASVVLLVVRQPPASPADMSVTERAGAELFATHCASCHGSGGIGASAPQLVGRVTQVYPDVEDQLAVVDAGRGSMPAFAGQLDPAAIRSIVDFTRLPAAGGGGAAAQDGRAIYLAECAACHGDFGEGTYGPAFKGGLAAQRFPQSGDQSAVVAKGVDGTPMKAFG